MNIIVLTTSYMESHCYLLAEHGRAVVIDPGDFDLVAEAVRKENLTLDVAIVTHEHCDHVYGCTGVREEFHCKILASRLCSLNMQNPRKNFSQYFDAFIELQTSLPPEQQKGIPPFTACADEVFEREKSFDWQGHSFYLRETPGHSPGSICILVDGKILFSGDTLMKDDAARTEFPGGSQKQLCENTMPWLESLPAEVEVYPGHGESFLLGDKLKCSKTI